MKALIWKELLENLKWVPLPGLAIVIVFLLARPSAPMPHATQAFFYALIAVSFGAGLGFVQIYFDGQGDKRSLLMHRPLSPSCIFLAKALAGVGLYSLALGIPFVCLESWLAMPAKVGRGPSARPGRPATSSSPGAGGLTCPVQSLAHDPDGRRRPFTAPAHPVGEAAAVSVGAVVAGRCDPPVQGRLALTRVTKRTTWPLLYLHGLTSCPCPIPSATPSAPV